MSRTFDAVSKLLCQHLYKDVSRLIIKYLYTELWRYNRKHLPNGKHCQWQRPSHPATAFFCFRIRRHRHSWFMAAIINGVLYDWNMQVDRVQEVIDYFESYCPKFLVLDIPFSDTSEWSSDSDEEEMIRSAKAKADSMCIETHTKVQYVTIEKEFKIRGRIYPRIKWGVK